MIAQLNQTIQELKEQLNKKSKNSSKPPSSDGYKKPVPKSLRKPSGKKTGGQDGHQGTHLAVITASDEIVKHMPSACEGCQHYQICKGTACTAEKRHVIDAVVTVNVTEHQALKPPICMLYGDTRRGDFPSDVKDSVQYIERLLPLEKDATSIQDKNTTKLREDMAHRYFDAPDLQGVGKNAYRFINAVSDFATHAKPLRRTANYNENLFARTVDGNPLIDKAYQLVRAA